MKYELFIAKRYLRSKHRLNFITIISLLSTLGISIGVAALIVVLSVFNGFGNIVTSLMVNFDPHVKVTAVSPDAYNSIDTLKTKILSLEQVKEVSPFVMGKSIVVSKRTYSVINLKGIDPMADGQTHGIRTKIMAGWFNLMPNGFYNNAVVGLGLALKLSLMIGDTITVTSFRNIEASVATYAMPRVSKYIISGVFNSGNKDYDFSSVFTNLDAAQYTFDSGGNIDGYDIFLNNISQSNAVKETMLKQTDAGKFRTETWYDLHKDLYTVMIIERWAAYIILSLIIFVATFNVLGSLTMSVVEKKKDIGVLISMGATGKSIMKIFMFEGMLAGIIGTVAGSIFGYCVCLVQIYYKIYPLDRTKYIIDAIPIDMRFSDFIAVAVMALFLSFIAALYPAKRASKINAIEAIKWE
jgi:lipoprotein-releasing system permease protein